MELDHRELNRHMSIFATDPLAGSGLPMWLPAGAIIRRELEALATELARADGCQAVYTPALGKRALFERSGHLDKYSQDMFPAMAFGGEQIMLRPANCPHHALIYASENRSYRELPLRLNELASMFRAERSGVVSGLNRVRQISLDDTHVFCRPDQVADEAARGLRCALRAQRILGLPIDHVRLSMRDASDSWLGSAAQWQQAQNSLRSAGLPIIEEYGLCMVEAPGEAAFYGPKFDVQVIDGRDREETIATVQLDFNQPARFELTYIGEDGRPQRPVMIHRGTVGSMERVTAALMEHYQGRLPFWLAPVHLTLLPISAEHDSAVRAIAEAMTAEGLRPRIDHDGPLGARIRRSRTRRDHLIGVVGSSETDRNAVQITDVSAGVRARLEVPRLIAMMKGAYRTRRARLDWDA